MRLGRIFASLGVATLLLSAAPIAAQAQMDGGRMHGRMMRHHDRMMMHHDRMMMRHDRMHHRMMRHRMMRHRMMNM